MRRGSTSTSSSTLLPVDANGNELSADRRRAGAGAGARAGVHRPALEDAAGGAERRRDAGGRVRGRIDRGRARRSISVEGDANDLAGLDRADTLPISVSGASSQVTSRSSASRCPTACRPSAAATVHGDRPAAARDRHANLRGGPGPRRVAAGTSSTSLSVDRVLVTIGGSIADLDRLSGVNLVLTADVTGLEVGTHSVAVSANLATGLTLARREPQPRRGDRLQSRAIARAVTSAFAGAVLTA